MKQYSLLGGLLLVLFMVGSCNIEKRVDKQQKTFDNIGKKWLLLHPCSNDSSYIYVPGKRDSIPFIVPVMIDDTTGVARRLDSLNIYLQNKYNEQLKDCSNQVNESYKLGYNKATQIWRTKLSQIKIPIPVIDTIKITLKDKLSLKLLEQDLATANKELADSKLSNEKAQGKRDKWFLMFIIACCLLVTSIYFNIKK